MNKILPMLLLSLFFLQCNSDSTAPDNNRTSQITINGRLNPAGLAKNGAFAVPTQVLIYRDFGKADITAVRTDGVFSITVDRKPCGLVFLDAADSVIGVLSLAAGIDALPLTMIDSTVSVVDLKTISIQQGIGTPEHNPIDPGGEAEMTADERAVYRLQSALFSAIIRNLDMDGDGNIDVLAARKYWMRFGSDFDGGTAPTADPGSGAPMPRQNVFHFNFSDGETPAAEPKAILTAPDGMQFLCHEASTNDFTQYHWVLQNTSWSSFIEGRYSILYAGTRSVTFSVASPLKMDNYIVAAQLWYEKTGSIITRVHWKWRMLNGAPIDASRLLKKHVILQFNYNGFSSQKNYQLTSSDTQCDVNVDANNLMQILVSCNDLFGNWQPTFYSIQ